MTLLPQSTILYQGNIARPGSASYLNSYCRCLLDWSHYRKQQAERTLAAASLRFDKMQRGWSFRHLWNPFATMVGNLFTRPNNYAEVAEESARSCLAGLSRIGEPAAPKLAPIPETDEPSVSVPDHQPQLPLLTAGNLR